MFLRIHDFAWSVNKVETAQVPSGRVDTLSMTYDGPERRISGQSDRRAFVRALMVVSDRRRGPECTTTCQCEDCGAVDADEQATVV